MRLAIDKGEDILTVKELEDFLEAARKVGAEDETPVYFPDHHSNELSVDF